MGWWIKNPDKVVETGDGRDECNKCKIGVIRSVEESDRISRAMRALK